MQVILRPVEMVAAFRRNGQLSPLRFRLLTDRGYETIQIHGVQRVRREKAGLRLLDIFTCTAKVAGYDRLLELKYEVESGEWSLYRM